MAKEKPLSEILSRMDSAIEKYETKQLGLISDQAEILRDLSTSVYWLTAHRVEYHKAWMKHYFNHKGSNAAKERYADNEVPELYMIRQFMDSAKKAMDSMRSTLSANKN